jgi:hypothetical protein
VEQELGAGILLAPVVRQQLDEVDPELLGELAPHGLSDRLVGQELSPGELPEPAVPFVRGPPAQ